MIPLALLLLLAPGAAPGQAVDSTDAPLARLDSLYRAGELRGGVALADSALSALVGDGAPRRDSPTVAARARLLVARGKLSATDAFVSHRPLDDALRTLRRAAELAEETGVPEIRADAQLELGFAEYVQAFLTDGAFAPVRPRFRRSLRLGRELGDPRRTARALFHLGLIHERLGEQTAASDRFRQSLALADACGCRLVQSYAQRHLGFARIRAGDLRGALLHLERSLELREAVGFTVYLPYSLAVIADVRRELGEPAAALPYARRAVRVASGLEAPRTRVVAGLSLAEVLLALGRRAEARERFREALETSREIGYSPGVRRARDGLDRGGNE